MFELTELRIFGLLIGVIVLLFVFSKLRVHSESRKGVWTLILFAFTVAVVSVFPSIVNIPADLFSLDNHPSGRLITLLILSTLLLWLTVLYERGKLAAVRGQMDRFTRNVALKDFHDQYQSVTIKNRILILIPAFDEAENLSSLLPGIPDKILGRKVTVIVIDDGSKDGTEAVAKKEKAMVVSHPVNRGGGAALKTGYAITRAMENCIIVTMDGDGQHDPSELESLIEPIIKSEADFTIGSRVLGGMDRYSTLRFVGVHVFNFLINRMMGAKITDCASGYRAFTSKLLLACVLQEEQYHTSELIIEALKKKFRVKDIPVHIAARKFGHSKKGHSIKYAFLFLKTIIKTWLR
ncbi:MAG: DUF2304 family protein [Leptospirales bacterium]